MFRLQLPISNSVFSCIGFSSYVCHADPPGTSVDQKRESNAEKSDSEDDLAKLREGVPQLQQRRKRQADSSDWISSQLTRRFGLHSCP